MRAPASAALSAAQRDWVARLAAVYDEIAHGRMAGLPLMHPGLHVQAVGFVAREGGCLGVLLTPWFMNLVWCDAQPVSGEALALGAHRERDLGGQRLAFIGAHEPSLGAFEACALFSPMSEFADQAGAVATAEAVMVALCAAAEVAQGEARHQGNQQAGQQTDQPVLAAAASPSHGTVAPSLSDRRRFLFGRTGASRP
jgi:[NiFe] hydrogenase assembly HybE family chaperone